MENVTVTCESSFVWELKWVSNVLVEKDRTQITKHSPYQCSRCKNKATAVAQWRVLSKYWCHGSNSTSSSPPFVMRIQVEMSKQRQVHAKVVLNLPQKIDTIRTIWVLIKLCSSGNDHSSGNKIVRSRTRKKKTWKHIQNNAKITEAFFRGFETWYEQRVQTLQGPLDQYHSIPICTVLSSCHVCLILSYVNQAIKFNLLHLHCLGAAPFGRWKLMGEVEGCDQADKGPRPCAS